MNSAKRKERAIEVDTESADDDDTVLVVYPDDGPDILDAISITTGDKKRLTPGEFLNDNLVNFYFKRMVAEHEHDGTPLSLLPAAHRERVHITASPIAREGQRVRGLRPRSAPRTR